MFSESCQCLRAMNARLEITSSITFPLFLLFLWDVVYLVTEDFRLFLD